MKRSRLRSVPVPSRPNPQPNNVAGTAFDIKFFPCSNDAKVHGPYTDPAQVPKPAVSTANASTFPGWVDYYVNLIGFRLEKLNALQFNLDQNPNVIARAISDELGRLADELLVGQATGPQQLFWPLAGAYNLSWPVVEAQKLGFDTFDFSLFFENEPDYRMVVNASIEINATDAANIAAPNSSSSSYIGASSSSR